MKLDNLIDILINIRDTYNAGNINVDLYYDVNQSESPNKRNDITTDNIRTVKIGNNNIFISNEFGYNEEYLGYSCDAKYYPDEKLYKGIVILDQAIPDYDLTFTTTNKYEISAEFHKKVDEYVKYINEKNVSKTIKAVNDILGVKEYPDSPDDSEYE